MAGDVMSRPPPEPEPPSSLGVPPRAELEDTVVLVTLTAPPLASRVPP